MKKNLFFAAAIAVVAIFSSCTPAEEPATVSITLDKDTVVLNSAVTGKISTVGGDLVSVTLMKNDATVAGYPVTTFTKGAVMGNGGTYTIRFDSLAVGNYSIKAVGKNSSEATKKFVVKSPAVVVVPTLEVAASNVTIYCNSGDGYSAKSTCASADGKTYAPKVDATTFLDVATQAKVDFVYFNDKGTSFGIYAPSAVPTAISTSFSGWTTKNPTTFAKSTSIVYSSATYTQVADAAKTITANSVTGLEKGDVVVFKTASGKVGLFEVVSKTNGYNPVDNVVVNIKISK
jgi:hypothetical protein